MVTSKANADINITDAVRASAELDEILGWISAPVLETVNFAIRCGPDVDTDTHLAISYAFSVPAAEIEVGGARECLRDALISWACASEDGQNAIQRLARSLPASPEDVESEVRLLLGELLSPSIEAIHDEALEAVFADHPERDLIAALVARLLFMFPELSDEKVHAVLARRLAASVMTS